MKFVISDGMITKLRLNSTTYQYNRWNHCSVIFCYSILHDNEYTLPVTHSVRRISVGIHCSEAGCSSSSGLEYQGEKWIYVRQRHSTVNARLYTHEFKL